MAARNEYKLGPMELNVTVEKTSNILRKLTIKVPASIVSKRFESGLVEAQKSAKLKGFRPGQAPISVIKQNYGDDVRHQVYHHLIEETFREAVKKHQLRAVGNPKIEAADFKHGEGAHDHGIKEDQDFTYIATVEVMPELDLKSYTGIALTKPKVKITAEDVTKVIEGFRNAHAELVPVAGGLVLGDGNMSSPPVTKGQYADITFKGALVTSEGLKPMDGMSGSKMLEVGGGELIPGFEDELVGMRKSETKTFRIKFPKDYHDKEMASKEAEFTVTINEVKDKKLPELNDDFAKQAGFETMAEFKVKAEEYLKADMADQADKTIRNDLIAKIIEKNPFDVPESLINAQMDLLVRDWAQELKSQGANDDAIRQVIMRDLASIRQRAESQVRASLILETIFDKEKLELKPDQVKDEIKKMAQHTKTPEDKLLEFYDRNPERYEEMAFRVRQENTIQYLLSQSKVTEK
jgi:trigger factor